MLSFFPAVTALSLIFFPVETSRTFPSDCIFACAHALIATAVSTEVNLKQLKVRMCVCVCDVQSPLSLPFVWALKLDVSAALTKCIFS